VLVQVMAWNSSAYRGGLRPGDIVVGFNGTPVTDPGHLSRLISDAQIGSTATVTVLRDGRRSNLQITIVKVGANPR
jgi:serine protease Do